MNHSTKQYGFTLIELMLAMGFVSALLLAIAMTVIQIGNIYNRGITYKNVNQAGSALASELQRGINGSTQFGLPTDPNGNSAHYVNETWGGRLCVGQYSYIWNYGAALKEGNASLNKYSNLAVQINFIKVLDPNASYCTDATTTKITVDSADSVELLNVGQNDLAIHSFTISSDPTLAYDSKTGQRLYSISFLLGTNDQEALTVSSGSAACLLENDVKSDPSYCAVNQFDIVARAGNNATE